MKDPVVIVNPEGKFLRSASFWNGVCSANWVSEYPDATEYTTDEARATVRKMRDFGKHCRGIIRYGFEDEAVIA